MRSKPIENHLLNKWFHWLSMYYIRPPKLYRWTSSTSKDATLMVIYTLLDLLYPFLIKIMHSNSGVHYFFFHIILDKLIIGNTKGFIRGKALSVEGHTHDDRYYTETEVDTKLNGKANSTHTHIASDINSGILSVEHGGTGSASLDDFLNKLNTVKVHSGTYVGNDKYGSSNRNSIILPFATKFVLIYSPNGGALLFVYNAPYGINIIETNRNMSAYWEINKLSWYNDYSANVQMNVSGVTYGYYVFG